MTPQEAMAKHLAAAKMAQQIRANLDAATKIAAVTADLRAIRKANQKASNLGTAFCVVLVLFVLGMMAAGVHP